MVPKYCGAVLHRDTSEASDDRIDGASVPGCHRHIEPAASQFVGNRRSNSLGSTSDKRHTTDKGRKGETHAVVSVFAEKPRTADFPCAASGIRVVSWHSDMHD